MYSDLQAYHIQFCWNNLHPLWGLKLKPSDQFCHLMRNNLHPLWGLKHHNTHNLFSLSEKQSTPLMGTVLSFSVKISAKKPSPFFLGEGFYLVNLILENIIRQWIRTDTLYYAKKRTETLTHRIKIAVLINVSTPVMSTRMCNKNISKYIKFLCPLEINFSDGQYFFAVKVI